jgi:hypothetical protein
MSDPLVWFKTTPKREEEYVGPGLRPRLRHLAPTLRRADGTTATKSTLNARKAASRRRAKAAKVSRRAGR